jgi:hypothetical protein
MAISCCRDRPSRPGGTKERGSKVVDPTPNPTDLRRVPGWADARARASGLGAARHRAGGAVPRGGRPHRLVRADLRCRAPGRRLDAVGPPADPRSSRGRASPESRGRRPRARDRRGCVRDRVRRCRRAALPVITAEPDDVRYAVFLTPDQRGGHHDLRPRQSAVRAAVRRRVPAARDARGQPAAAGRRGRAPRGGNRRRAAATVVRGAGQRDRPARRVSSTDVPAAMGSIASSSALR